MTTPDEEQKVKELLREWIGQRTQRLILGGLRDDTLILEQRVITSLQVMELILFVERTSGRSVNVSQLKPCSFRSINNIYSTFFTENRHEQLPA